MKYEMISVIIPIYNAEHYLDVCIKSVLNQTYQNIEILLIDDGSIDKSGEICDTYQKLDNRIRVIHKKNEGVSSARNTGIKNSKGTYIAFVDSDDFVDKKYLEVLYHNILKQKVELSICNFKYKLNKDYADNKVKLESEKILLDNQLDYFKYSSLFKYVWGKLFKKSFLENISFDTDILMSEDTLFVIEVVKKISVFYYDQQPLYTYRMQPKSATHVRDRKTMESLAVAWRKIFELQEEGSKGYCWAGLCYLEACRRSAAEIYISKKGDMKKVNELWNDAKEHKEIVWKADVSLKRKFAILLFLKFPAFYFFIYYLKRKMEKKFLKDDYILE